MPSRSPIPFNYRQRITSAMAHIEANLEHVLELNAIAREACLSPYHFHKIFKLITGETPGEYVRRLRLEKAINILGAHPEKSITEVSAYSGFSSSQNFAKALKKEFGISPSAVRTANDLQTRIAQHRQNRNPGNARSANTGQNAGFLQLHKEAAMLPLTIKSVRNTQMLYQRLIGDYSAKVKDTLTELFHFAEDNGIQATESCVIFWDNPEITSPEKCRADVGLLTETPVKNAAPYNLQALPEGNYAHYNGTLKLPSEFESIWDRMMATIVQKQWTLDDRPCFKVLHKDVEAEKTGAFNVSFYIPVK